MRYPGNDWIRKYIWDAKADVGAVKIDDVSLTADIDYGGVQLWENGPYWANCNVGATRPEEPGYYFWWSSTDGYTRNSSNSGWVASSDGTPFNFENIGYYCMSYSSLLSKGYIDSAGRLVAKCDAATVHFGAPWRMPTDSEITALVNNCDTTWTTLNNVQGRLVRGRGAYSSKSIFLPAVGVGDTNSDLKDFGYGGYYWSSNPTVDVANYAWALNLSSKDFRVYYCGRYKGVPVRPVRGIPSN